MELIHRLVFFALVSLFAIGINATAQALPDYVVTYSYSLAGASSSVTATVKNVGDSSAPASVSFVNVKVIFETINCKKQTSRTRTWIKGIKAGYLTPGASHTVQFPTPLDDGEFLVELFVVVDPNNAIAEGGRFGESNNAPPGLIFEINCGTANSNAHFASFAQAFTTRNAFTRAIIPASEDAQNADRVVDCECPFRQFSLVLG